MSKAKPKINSISVNLDPKPKGEFKDVGGSQQDVWNMRLANLVVSTLPDHASEGAATAAVSAMVDLKPADPVEGMLIGQMIAANEAAMCSYQRAWIQPPEYLDARLKYLAEADKAARTVALISERLDRHRTQGHQQIVVKHVTVNADQAVVTDTLVTAASGGNPLSAEKLLTNDPVASYRMPEAAKPEPELVPVGRGKEPK